MGLFSRKKEDDISQHIQNLEIKQATTQQNNNINNNAFPNFSTSQDTANEQSFVNPFQEDLTVNTNINQNPSIPKTSNYYQKQNLENDFNSNNNSNTYPNFNSQNQIQTPPTNFQVLQNQTPNNYNQNYNNLNTNSNLNTSNNSIFSNQTQPSVQNLNQNTQTNLINKDEIQEMIDETIEKLLEEKWESLVENVGKIANWKEKQETDVKQLKEDLLVIKDNFEKIEKKFNSRLSDYDKNILDVNSEIKALEKVFQKITPTLVNNVNELSKIADNLRGLKPNNLINENNSKQSQEQYKNNSKSLLE